MLQSNKTKQSQSDERETCRFRHLGDLDKFDDAARSPVATRDSHRVEAQLYVVD